MDSGRFLFDSAPSHGRMFLLGGGGGGGGSPIFRPGGRSAFGILEESAGAGAGGANKKRPFFTSPEELFDEEYYDEQLPEKKRRLTPEQVLLLERSFEAENKLEPERKSELARKLGLQPRQVSVWFQNRRARWKTKQIESDFDRLKSSYDSLVAEHDALLKDNDRLRSQVVALTEKLQQRELDAAPGLKQEEKVGSNADLASLNGHQKSEDGLSSGSGGSVVVDGDGPQHLVVDSSGASYFPEAAYNCVQEGPADHGVLSEEDDANDERCSYYPDDVFASVHQPQEEEEPLQLGWWVWS